MLPVLKRLPLLVLLSVIATTLDAEPRVVLTVGHAGAVRDATAHPTANVAFTVGDDGRLLVWDLDNNALQARYQVSHRPITRVVAHPERDEVALVVNENVDRSSLRVLNWKTGEEVFRHDLAGIPTYLSYSPTGSYLIYALPNFQSLHFLTADRGTPRSYLDDGFGIVTFVQMGASERNIMTYVPARGEFIYWSLQSGSELQRVRTLPRLAHLTLVDPVNRRALAAAGDNQLVIVDNLTGEVRATYPISPITDIRFDDTNARIMVLSEQLGQRTLLSFTYQNGRLRRDFFRPAGLSPSTQVVVPLPSSANAILTGNADGEVDLFSDGTGRETVLGPRPIVPITDVAFTEGRMHVSLGDHLLSFVSDAFQSAARTVSVSSIRTSVTELPGLEDAHMERVGKRLLIWGRGDTVAGTIFQLAPPSTTATPFITDDSESPLLDLRSTADGPIAVYRDGRVQILSTGLPLTRFEYATVGAQTASWAPDAGLVIAKTRTSAFDSSLIVVNQRTGETVPIMSEAFLSTDVTFADESTLYAISLFGSPASPVTRLVRYSGDGFQRDTTISAFPGEDAAAAILWDPRTGSLLTTLGYDGVRRFVGRTETPLTSTGQLPQKLTTGGLFIASVNADGSVSLWNRDTGEFLFDLYVFENDGWLALTADGAYYASTRLIEQRFLDFVSDRRTRLRMEDFRITLPYRE